ncbi:MAG TPA: hypothetical protein VG148_07180 [Pyrinomonadaceae bacterium]|nr:hypothetical protein [Pyrinomonadaceae bacterium]
MTLAQFLLPGEVVLYESPGVVYYGRTPFTLRVTGERLLLHAVTGRLARRERVIAEPLSGVGLMQYSEEGLVSTRGRLDIRFPNSLLSLTGSPSTIKEVWRALQRHTHRQPDGEAGEEVTLVVPPPPLFDDQTRPPAQVQPLAAPPRPRRLDGRAAVVGLVCLAALAALAAALLLGRRAAAPEQVPHEAAAAATPPPATPAPTPVTLRIMDEVFKLEEGSHRAVKFSVPAGPAPARVSGGFRVTSGSYVDFYLMSREQYERFAAEGEPDVTSVVYREGQWNARVGERLPAGEYYLVFDNYDSDDGAQTVAAEFVLVFDAGGPAR